MCMSSLKHLREINFSNGRGGGWGGGELWRTMPSDGVLWARRVTVVILDLDSEGGSGDVAPEYVDSKLQ